MTQAYSDPSRENEEHALPDVETFYVKRGSNPGFGECDLEPGWYWWACFPGCLPDSEPNGPFATHDEALADAQNLD